MADGAPNLNADDYVQPHNIEAEQALLEGQATKLNAEALKDLPKFIANKMYYPEYVPLVEKREITI